MRMTDLGKEKAARRIAARGGESRLLELAEETGCGGRCCTRRRLRRIQRDLPAFSFHHTAAAWPASSPSGMHARAGTSTRPQLCGDSLSGVRRPAPRLFARVGGKQKKPGRFAIRAFLQACKDTHAQEFTPNKGGLQHCRAVSFRDPRALPAARPRTERWGNATPRRCPGSCRWPSDAASPGCRPWR